tara:strand:+ start:1001 stop:1279 length:279 start_codon:yes stop_codon:yes gene_type:complete
MMTAEPTEQEMEQMSPEDLAKKKKEMLDFYTESIPYLDAQHKYEETLMKLDEVRFKRAQIQMQFAMMMNPPEEMEEEPEPQPQPKKRSLKKK